jgi:hypothetical protein
MNDRFSKLAKERAELLVELSKVESQLSQELKTMGKPAPVTKKPGRPKTKAKTNPDSATPSGDGDAATATTKSSKRSLKSVVQEILSGNKDGLEMKEVVEAVKTLITKGEYDSKADNVAAVVAQALFHLQKGNIVQRNKETKRYTVAAA